MEKKKNEKWLAFPAKALASVLCRHCTVCGKRDSRRAHPTHCPNVKNFITELRDPSFYHRTDASNFAP